MSNVTIYEVAGNLSMWDSGLYAAFEGRHRWWLGSVKCHTCGAVWGDNVTYPWMDLSNLPEEKSLRDVGVCVRSLEELEVLRKAIAPLLPVDLPLPPGTEFGLFKGQHTAGKLEDFNFYLWNWFVSRSAYERLRERGALSLGATPAQVKNRKGDTLDYLELHVMPRARLGSPRTQKPGVKYERYCPVCGFDSRSAPEPLVIDRASVPHNEELFLLQDAPQMGFCTEKFKEGVEALELTGLEFKPVATVGAEQEASGTPLGVGPTIPSGIVATAREVKEWSPPARTVEAVVALAAECGMSDPDQVRSLARAMAWWRLRRDVMGVWDSRMGGRPVLPDGKRWPQRRRRPLAFLGCLDLEHLPEAVTGQGFPRSGLLEFFYDAEEQPWGIEPGDRDGWLVMYLPPDERPEAKLAPWPKALAEDYRMEPYGLSAEVVWTLPTLDSCWMEGLAWPEALTESYQHLLERLSGQDVEVERILTGGHPDLLQGDVMRECALARGGVFEGMVPVKEARKATLLAERPEWRLLLQVPGLDAEGFEWSDAGRLYYCIREKDLRAGRFDRVWLQLQCA